MKALRNLMKLIKIVQSGRDVNVGLQVGFFIQINSDVAYDFSQL